MFGLGLLDLIKGGLGLVLGAALVFYPAKLIGRGEGRESVRAEAAKEALERIDTLEKNNANFRNLSDRDRCLVFMRDSGLSESSCD